MGGEGQLHIEIPLAGEASWENALIIISVVTMDSNNSAILKIQVI
jgi:hypothetical protein